ncbi:ABC transporter permease subunit [Chthonomonas calidirosea]|uniref:ABC transporter permease subunit n=1 Tax=Chthonomonas calidirosea TaxID=454171 RepID=UPI0006ECA883|nr:ABC transporter permease [Chthonomonas calidirosea]CEK13034.1 ABC-type transport system involved in multi-copper enzyme maturation, permease component [Chthonomonas calidirosea]
MWENPIFLREMRIRLPKHRGVRIGVLIMAAVFLLTVYLRMITELAQRNVSSDADILWAILVWVQFLFTLFAAPAYAANAFSREKEQQTWDLLLTTPLTASEIVLGKLMGRFAIFLLPIVLILPLEILIAFALGYYTNGLFFLTLLTLLIFTFFFISLSLYASWCLSRTLYAQIVSYTVLIGILCIGTSLLTAAVLVLSSISTGTTNSSSQLPWLWLNPIYLFSLLFEKPTDHLYQLGVGLFVYLVLGTLMIYHIIHNLRRHRE